MSIRVQVASSAPSSIEPTTQQPTKALPTTAAPTTAAPTTAAPTTLAPTTPAPTAPPTTNHHHHRHHSAKQELEIDSSVILGFVLICVLALCYRKRKKIPGYLLQIKYYLCCCRLSEQEILDQQPEHATLNDFLFEVQGPEEPGRVNVSRLTDDDDDNDIDSDGPPVGEVNVMSINSFFPDLLGGEATGTEQSSPRRQRRPNNTSNNNSLEEPLIPRQQT